MQTFSVQWMMQTSMNVDEGSDQFLLDMSACLFIMAVKPVLSGLLKIAEPKISMEDGSSMEVESIEECSTRSILQYFRPVLSNNCY